MEKIQFYFNPKSRARIVHWALEEVGAPYDLHTLDLQSGEHKTDDFLKMNPMGKIPTIVHGDIVVTEAAAICSYLADAFPHTELAPSLTDPKRGSYYRWMFFSAGCVEQAITDVHFPRAEAASPSTLGYGSVDQVVKTLKEAIPSSGFLLGDKFSMVDLFMCTQLHWGMLFKGIEEEPLFTDYVNRCQDRSSFKSHIEKIGPMG